jgi:toxin ParE1/3/4
MRVRLLRAALGDLDAIAAYIADDNPVAARRFVSRLVARIDHLSAHPALGRAGRVVGSRELMFPPYIVPYRVRSNVIEILRVFLGAQRFSEKL